MGVHCGPEHHKCHLEYTIGLGSTFHFVSCPDHMTLCLDEVIKSMSTDMYFLEEIEKHLRKNE